MQDTWAMLPATVWPGRLLVHGLARVAFTSGRVLEVSDPYGSQRIVVAEPAAPVVVPTHPVYRPRRISDCLVVELSEPVVVRRGELWVRAPYELEVRVGDSVVSRLTPVKAKYILHGELIGGRICRYYRSGVSAHEPGEAGDGEGLVKVRFKLSSETKVTHVVVAAEALDVYVHPGTGRVYYSVVEVQGNSVLQVFRVTGERPRQGLRRVKRSQVLRGRSIASKGDLSWHPLMPA